MINYPKNINKNEIVGLTSTSNGLADQNYLDRIVSSTKYMENRGYLIKETNNVRNKSHKLASSSGETRAKEFLELWEDNEVKCIAQTFGGSFLVDMLPYIDSKLILENNIKWVFGYSDSSLLNFYLTTNYNFATLTCDNITNFSKEPIHKSSLTTLKILEELKPLDTIVQESFDLYEKEKLPRDQKRFNIPYNLTEKVQYKNLYGKNPEKISGRLIGGCLDVLVLLLGTPFDKTKTFCNQFEEGMLWYLENYGLSTPALYRALWQMKQAGWFKNANGIIIGRTRSKEDVEDFSYTDALNKVFDDLNIPVIYDIDTGHVSPQWTMINGSFAEFEYEKGRGKLTQILK